VKDADASAHNDGIPRSKEKKLDVPPRKSYRDANPQRQPLLRNLLSPLSYNIAQQPETQQYFG
jgi:hypothetical protein